MSATNPNSSTSVADVAKWCAMRSTSAGLVTRWLSIHFATPESRRDEPPQGVRQLARKRHRDWKAGVFVTRRRFRQQREELFEEERVATAAVEQQVAQVVGHRAFGDRLEEGRGGLTRERVEVQ